MEQSHFSRGRWRVRYRKNFLSPIYNASRILSIVQAGDQGAWVPYGAALVGLAALGVCHGLHDLDHRVLFRVRNLGWRSLLLEHKVWQVVFRLNPLLLLTLH